MSPSMLAARLDARISRKVDFRGETVTSAVMDRSTDRTVIHDGRVVADGGALC